MLLKILNKRLGKRLSAIAGVLLLVGCGGGDDTVNIAGSGTGTRSVLVSWTPNREVAVNRTGGGYRVYSSRTAGASLGSASVQDVPYTSGATAPTSTVLLLPTGNNYIRVVAYSALNPSGSAASTEITLSVR